MRDCFVRKEDKRLLGEMEAKIHFCASDWQCLAGIANSDGISLPDLLSFRFREMERSDKIMFIDIYRYEKI